MSKNLLNDLSILTTIPQISLAKLMDKLNWCICNTIEESILESNNIIDMDLGIGKLFLTIENNSLEYKFVPSAKLESNIIKTIKERKNPLINNLEASLVSKIVNVYKDMV